MLNEKKSMFGGKGLFTFPALLILFTFNLSAQWQADLRLTNDPNVSSTSVNHAWCVAASGNFVHVTWFDDRDGNNEIYYKRSTDGGLSWGTETRMTNDPANSDYPCIAVSSLIVHIVWTDYRSGSASQGEIYYKRSTDGGASWGADTRLTNNSFDSDHPSVTASGLSVHLVWQDDRDGNLEIYYKRSTDGGLNWGPDTRLTNNIFFSSYPSVSVSGSIVNVTWEDSRDGNSEIYYKHSTDGGTTWGSDTRLTNNPANSYFSCNASSGSKVHVVWTDERDGNAEIYYKLSTDDGNTWGSDVRLTNNPANSFFPSVAASGSNVHIVWRDNRDGNPEIYYKRSTDGGITWGADTRLTNAQASLFFPSVAVFGSALHVVWQDGRDGNFEIYYKRDPTGNPVGINPVSSEIPNKFKLEQNYPNPFNPSTKIKFDIPMGSGRDHSVQLKIYDILGKEVATLVNEPLQPGKYEIDFNASNLSSGMYFYRMEARQTGSLTSDYRDIKKMVLVK